MLLRRALLDPGLATYAAKDKYNRARRFVVTGETTCTPAEQPALAKVGSYPSGHAPIGWAWALLLVQAAPQNMDALLQRGHAFGQSRVICGVHWQSDVDAGRLIGAAAVARLQSDATFKAQLALARHEIAKAQAQAQGPKPDADGAAEAAALKLQRSARLPCRGTEGVPGTQSACLRRKAGISISSMPLLESASTLAAALCERAVRQTLGVFSSL